MLKIAFHLAVKATFRIGTAMGLNWDTMDISDEEWDMVEGVLDTFLNDENMQ